MDATRRSGRPRQLPAAAVLGAFAVLLLAPAALADEPLRYNCPEGFIWVRMSGTACVQETVPTNGKIGYDGHALCIDPLVGIYETRRTTDGKGVPGNPSSTYAYLLECVTQEELAARQERAAQPSQMGDIGRLLALGDRVLPPAELVLLGALGTGALVFAALPANRRRAGLIGRPVPPAAEPEPPPSTAPDPSAPLDPSELRRRIQALDEIDRRLAERIEWYRAEAAAGRLTPQDVVEWAGILSDIVGMIPVPAVQLPAGILSIGMNLAGIFGSDYDTRDVDRAIRAGLGDMARLRGILAVEREACVARLVEAENPPERPVAPVDPALLPDEALRAERDAAHERTMRAHDRERGAIDDWIELRERLRDQERRIDWLREHLPDLDTPPPEIADQPANTWANLAAGLDSYYRTAQKEVFSPEAEEARETMLSLIAGKSQGTMDDVLERVADAGGAARGADRAGAYANVVSGGTALVSAYEWFRERSVEQRRQIVEQALEGLRYDAGRLEAQIRQAETRMTETHTATEAESTRRRALSAEIDMRAARAGHLLWSH